MPRRGTVLLVLALIVGLTGDQQGFAGRWNRALEIGDQAPAWKDLAGVDGHRHALADYKDAKAVVLFFTCNSCPFASSMEDRIIALQKDYQNKGVQLIAVSVSPYEEDKLEPMKQRAEQKGFNFPYLYDETQEIGRDYGASCTPHFFLLDADRKVVYMGAMDDGDFSRKPQKHYLRDAIDAVLAGEDVAQAETHQRGCSIQYN